MDIDKIAEKWTEGYLPGCPKNIMGFISAKNAFIAGYNESCGLRWNTNMEEAPKDGMYLLLVDAKKYVHKASWVSVGPMQDKDWCIDNTYEYSYGRSKSVNNPIAWMPIPEYK